MSYPWIESRAKKDEEKTLKYGPMMWELKQRYNGYRVEQYKTPREVGEEASWSESTERTWADAEVGHFKHFKHCQNIYWTWIVPSISSSPIPIPPSLFSIQCCLANDCNNQSVAPRAFAHSCSISFHYPYYKADFTPSPEYLPLYSLPWVCLYNSRSRK